MILEVLLNQILIRDDKTIPASLTRNINALVVKNEKKELNGKFLYSTVTNQSLSNLEATNYEFNEEYQFLF
jgi:hypothetical protein